MILFVELTVKLINLVNHPLPLAPPNITAQYLPLPFIAAEPIYKYSRYTKKTLGLLHSLAHIQDSLTRVCFNSFFLKTLFPLFF